VRPSLIGCYIWSENHTFAMIRASKKCVAGAGYGSEPDEREKFREEAIVIAAKLEKYGMVAFAEAYAYGPTRVQFENKDPRGFAEFKAMLAEHSANGAANTQLGVQRERPSIFDLESKLAWCHVPMLVVTGDEDWPCLLPNVSSSAPAHPLPCSWFPTAVTP
jgi:hypothetical protein